MRQVFILVVSVILILRITSLHAEPIAIVGGTIIDGNGGEPISNGVIVIDKGKIIIMGDKKTSIPSSARKIDASGKYIIPGLMDANVHLIYGFSAAYMKKFEHQFEDIITEAVQITLKNGVTTVFDSWGPLESLKNVRNGINHHKITGSRIYLAGNIVGLDGPLSRDFYAKDLKDLSQEYIDRINGMWEQGVGRELMTMTPNQVREKIREYLAKDIDFFKYAINGHGPGNGPFFLFSPKVQNILIEETRKAGLTVQTHTVTVEGLRTAAEADTDLMQHCAITLEELIPDSTIQLIVDKQIACTFNVPSTKYLESVLSDNNGPKDPNVKASGFLRNVLTVTDENRRMLIKAGAKILLSTDGGIPWFDSPLMKGWAYKNMPEEAGDVLGNGHHIRLRALIDKGLSPMKALQAATRNIARAYKLDNLGTLEKGKIADLVILDGNPLADVENYRKIYLVMKEGQTINREALPEKRVLSDVNKYPGWK